MKPHFAFASSFMNVIEYECRDDTGSYRLTFRVGVSDYERSIYNGTPEQYDTHCAALVGWLTACWPIRIPPATVDAFNAWQREKTAACFAKMDAEPERYGFITPDDPGRNPLQAKGAAHWEGGWHFEPAGWLVAA